MKKQLLLSAALAITTIAQAGIRRHDVSAEKYKKLAAEKQFDCVGMVLDAEGGKQHGSCVLIGNKYILSAAHVFIRRDYRVDTFYVDKNGKRCERSVKGGSAIYVNTPLNERAGDIAEYSFRFNRHRYYGKQFRIFQSYLDSLNHPGNFCGDVVLIELKDTVEGVVPAGLNTAFDEKNGVITGVGYGASGTGDNAEDVGIFMEKIAGQNIVDNIEGFEVDGKATLLTCDFDHPGRKDCNQTGDARPLQLEWCPGGGDSGGGLFRQVNGQWQLVGIITGGPGSGLNMAQFKKTGGYYGSKMQFARVSVFNGWIHQTAAEFERTGMKLDADLK